MLAEFQIPQIAFKLSDVPHEIRIQCIGGGEQNVPDPDASQTLFDFGVGRDDAGIAAKVRQEVRIDTSRGRRPAAPRRDQQRDGDDRPSEPDGCRRRPVTELLYLTRGTIQPASMSRYTPVAQAERGGVVSGQEQGCEAASDRDHQTERLDGPDATDPQSQKAAGGCGDGPEDRCRQILRHSGQTVVSSSKGSPGVVVEVRPAAVQPNGQMNGGGRRDDGQDRSQQGRHQRDLQSDGGHRRSGGDDGRADRQTDVHHGSPIAGSDQHHRSQDRHHQPRQASPVPFDQRERVIDQNGFPDDGDLARVVSPAAR